MSTSDRHLASCVLIVFAVLCAGIPLIAFVGMALRDGPCMSRPATALTDTLVIMMFASIPLFLAGLVLAPRPGTTLSSDPA